MNFDNIPDEMACHANWVGWRYEQVKDRKTKVPYQINNPYKKASSTKSDTWASFDDAQTNHDLFDGVGFVFTKRVGITGIDLDKVISELGEINSLALEFIEMANSYTELSPSGRGFHIYVFAKIDKAVKTEAGEIYDEGRFFTVTGDIWNSVDVVRENQDAADYIAKALLDSRSEPAHNLSAANNVTQLKTAEMRLVEEFCLDNDCNALWEKITPFPSQNEYDLSIATRAHLRGYTANQCAVLIKQHRIKWNENPSKADRIDYMQNTLTKAFNVNTIDHLAQIEPEPSEDFFSRAKHIVNEPVQLKWLVKGYFPQGALVWLSGHWGVKKTFFALDLAYHIATGLTWCNHKTNSAKIVYVAGEGIGGLRKRLRGLCDVYGELQHDDDFLITKHSIMVNDIAALAMLTANLRPFDDVGLIVIDTKAANMKGSDSDPATMNDWVNAVRKLQITFNCAVLVIDHLNKQQGDSIRGVSQQDGAADAAYMLKKPDAEGEVIELSTYKPPKDFEAPEPLQFIPEIHTLGSQWNDEDGEPTTTVILKPLDAKDFPEQAQPRIGKNMQLALDVLEEMIDQCTDDNAKVERRMWSEQLKSVIPNRQRRSEAMSKCIEQNIVCSEGILIWLKRKPL